MALLLVFLISLIVFSVIRVRFYLNDFHIRSRLVVDISVCCVSTLFFQSSALLHFSKARTIEEKKEIEARSRWWRCFGRRLRSLAKSRSRATSELVGTTMFIFGFFSASPRKLRYTFVYVHMNKLKRSFCVYLESWMQMNEVSLLILNILQNSESLCDATTFPGINSASGNMGSSDCGSARAEQLALSCTF